MTGAVLAAATVLGVTDLLPLPFAMLIWLVLWVLYLSIVNVGQRWYSFGWESLLLEAGFIAVFLGNSSVAPPLPVLIALRWLLFRLEFGAGLIKLRGDACWRDLTCLYYHHETQPMPGPFSWYFHRLPRPLHRVEVAANHVTQLVVPFGLFLPQPVAGTCAAIMIITQLWLVISGNFAWLNWLTIVLALPVLPDAVWQTLLPGLSVELHADAPLWWVLVGCALGAAGGRAQLAAGAEPAVPDAGDERVVQCLAPGQHLRRLRQHHPRAVRDRHRGHPRPRRRDRLAGVRVPRQAGRSAPTAASVRALPPEARLAHVVRRVVAGATPSRGSRA